MLSALLFIACFGLIAALFGYICWTGRPREQPPDEAPGDGLPAREPELPGTG